MDLTNVLIILNYIYVRYVKITLTTHCALTLVRSQVQAVGLNIFKCVLF